MSDDYLPLMAQYRQLALDWEAARENPPEANRLFLEHHALYQRLRETQSGRAAITALLKDDAAAVRLLAATHSLAWEGERAEGVLEELEWEGGPLGIDAKWTLRSFRQGKLDLDW